MSKVMLTGEVVDCKRGSAVPSCLVSGVVAPKMGPRIGFCCSTSTCSGRWRGAARAPEALLGQVEYYKYWLGHWYQSQISILQSQISNLKSSRIIPEGLREISGAR